MRKDFMGVVPEKVGVNRCSGFCALESLLCVNVQRTLAQNRHSFEPDSFMGKMMNLRRKLAGAISLAALAHEEQSDKGGAAYILHPLRVMAQMTNDLDRIVAVLHDVAEDCPEYPLANLRKAFGDEVGDALDALTKRKGEAYDDYLARVEANPRAARVKMADLEDNSDLMRLGRKPTLADLERSAKYNGALARLSRSLIPA